MGIFQDAQGQVTTQSGIDSDRISNSFKICLVVLVTCNNEEGSIKNEGPRMATTLYIDFIPSKADNAAASDGIWAKFKLIQAFMHVLFTCKNEVTRVATAFFSL